MLCVNTLAATHVHAEGDAAAGQAVFKKRCQSCHAAGENPRPKSGPVLNGIVYLAAGSVDGFKSSRALIERAAAGLAWDAASRDAFLDKPRNFLPRTRMAFAGRKSEEDRAGIIACLAKF